jgi:hypothetical protein
MYIGMNEMPEMMPRFGEFSPTYWAVVFFGQFFSNYRTGTNSWATFSMVKVIESILKKRVGHYFGRFFYKLV